MNKCHSLLFIILLFVGCNLKEPSSKKSPPKKVYKPNISIIQDSIITIKKWDSIQLIQFWTFNCQQFKPYCDSINNEIHYYKTGILPQKSYYLLDSLTKLSNRENNGPESTCDNAYQIIGYNNGVAHNLIIIDECDMTPNGYLSQKGRIVLSNICLESKLSYKSCWPDSYYSN